MSYVVYFGYGRPMPYLRVPIRIGTTQFTIPKKKYANFCSRDRNWLAGWSISLPVTEIGWLATTAPDGRRQTPTRFLSIRVYSNCIAAGPWRMMITCVTPRVFSSGRHLKSDLRCVCNLITMPCTHLHRHPTLTQRKVKRSSAHKRIVSCVRVCPPSILHKCAEARTCPTLSHHGAWTVTTRTPLWVAPRTSPAPQTATNAGHSDD